MPASVASGREQANESRRVGAAVLIINNQKMSFECDYHAMVAL
jgi:hypothetical protein